MFTNRMRMTGFSGIDVADMVQQMMRAESFRLDRLRQQRDLNVWRQDMMRNMGTSIAQFQRRWTSVGVIGGRDIGDVNNWNANSATVTGTRLGGGVATGANITAGANAVQGTRTLTVNRLAQTHTFRSDPTVNHNAHANAGAATDRIDFGTMINRDHTGFQGFNDMTFRMNVNGIVRDVSVAGSHMNAIFAEIENANIVNPFSNDVMSRDDMAGALNWIENRTFYIAERNAELANPALTESERTALQDRITAAQNSINWNRDSLNAQFDLAMQHTGVAAERNAFAGAINDAIAGTFGAGRVNAAFNDGELVFRAVGEGNTASIVSGGGLGLNNVSANFNTQMTIESFLNEPALTNLEFSINNTNFRVNLADNTIEQRVAANGIGQGDATRTFVAPGDRALTVQDLMNFVNNSGAGANISYSALSGQFTMQATQSGEQGRIEIHSSPAQPTDFFARIFGPGYTSNSADNLNAEVTFNGVTLNRESNNFTVDGLTVNLTAAAQAGDEFTIEVGRDTDNVRQMLVDFVEEYNALVRSLIDMTEVRRPRQDRDGGFFMPLTEEQRRGMSDREIEMWEEQARIGILHRDDTLRTIQQELTNVLFLNIRTPDGRTFNLGNAGIQLSRDASEFGMLTIDEDRLSFALEHHADALQQLFTATSGPLSGFNADPNAPAGQRTALQQWGLEVGIADRLNHVFNRAISPTTGSITLRAGAAGTAFDNQNAMSRGIADQNRRIDNMLNWLQRREDSLFAQFSRMEAAMMQAQSQMMFFEQLLWGNV